MEHEKDYEIFTTREGTVVFALKPREKEPEEPRLIFDGQRHATFYRRPDEVILLDFLAKDCLEALKNTAEVLITEVDYAAEKVIRDYKVPVKIIKNNPFTDGLH